MKKIISGFLGLIMVVSLVACGSTTNRPVSWNSTSEPPEMNSVMTTTTGSGDVLFHVMNGLTELDEKDIPQPAIAESWDISEDGKTYTFKLRKDALWSNGEKVTAHDFVFALNLLFDPNTGAPYAGTWAPLIKGAEDAINLKSGEYEKKPVPQKLVDEALKNIGYKAVDDYTLQFELTGPYSFFPGILAFYSFLPINEKGFKEIGGLEKYGKDADKLVYNGAFEISEWVHDSKIILKKRADYYNAKAIKLDEIEFKMISDANTALNEFEAGDLDVTTLNGQQFQDFKKKGETIYEFADGSSWYLEFNTTLPGLKNKKIRKAMTLAVDAKKYVEKVVLNNSNVANSFVPAALVQGTFTKQVGDLMNRPTNDYSEVVKLFEEGLKEEGLTKETFKAEMITDDSSTAKTYGAYIKEQMKTILGFDLTISEMTYKSRIARMQSKDFQVVLSGWGPDYNDPMTFLDLFQSKNGNNHTSWANEKYDELVVAARAEGDKAKRDAIMIEMEKILADETPIGYIYNRSQSYVVNERVKGVVRTAFTNINLKYAELVEEK